MSFDVNKYPDLVRAIENKNLVLFVGAGLSYNFNNCSGETIGNWNNLVKKMIEHKITKGYNLDYLLPLIDKYEPIKILELLEISKGINKTEIYNFAKDFFDLSETNDYSLHKSLFYLCNKIITTNYDQAFVIANHELAKNVAYKGRNYELTTHKGNKPLLFKLHGCCLDAGSMVLFPSNYKELYDNPSCDAEHALSVLKNLIFNKTILFIGCGMGDFQINHIFKTIKNLQKDYNQKHFILSKGSLDSKLDFLTKIAINDHTEIPGIVEALIKVKTEHESKKSPEILAIEKDLLESNLKIKEIEEKLTNTITASQRKDLLIEKAAWDYFEKGLEYHQDNQYEEACKEYKKSIEYYPKNDSVFNNWGAALADLAELNSDEELYKQSFEKYKIATELNPKDDSAFNNWGNALSDLAKLNSDEELYKQSFEKFKIATELNPKDDATFNNWGSVLLGLAKLNSDEELFKQSIEKYKIATELNNKNDSAFGNWGTALLELTKLNSDKKLYKQSFEKFKIATELNSKDDSAFNNWGVALLNLARLTSDEELYKQSIEKYKKATELNTKYDYAFNNWGTALKDLAKLNSDEELYRQSFAKYQIATELNPNYANAFNNWGTALSALAKLKSDEKLLAQSIEILLKAVELGGGSYNLSCAYALLKDKTKALEALKNSLQNKEVKADEVEKDEDWQAFRGDPDYIKIIDEFRLK